MPLPALLALSMCGLLPATSLLLVLGSSAVNGGAVAECSLRCSNRAAQWAARADWPARCCPRSARSSLPLWAAKLHLPADDAHPHSQPRTLAVNYETSMDKWTMESSIWGCPCCLATTGGLSYCSLVGGRGFGREGGRVGGWQLPAALRRLRCQQLAGNAACGSMRTATATEWLQRAPTLCRSSTTAGGTSPIGHRSASATSQALKVRAGGQQEGAVYLLAGSKVPLKLPGGLGRALVLWPPCS